METGNELTPHQKLLLEMLKDFDLVCRKHKISYQLFAGTALGAARHRGFIPWDDDVDVILMRNEYERFFQEAASSFSNEKYYIQQEQSLHWPMHFSKLRRNNTTCMEKYHPKDEAMHQGVYIDIFPCDNLANGAFMRRLQFASSKIIIAKALYMRGYETNNIIKKIFMQICRGLPARPFYAICMRRKDGASGMVHSFLAAGKKYKRNIFPRGWLKESIEIQFEDAKFPISVNYNELLTGLYGDWKTLPAMKDRQCKEHVFLLDLNQSYIEHLTEQRAMHVDNYTRSIR